MTSDDQNRKNSGQGKHSNERKGEEAAMSEGDKPSTVSPHEKTEQDGARDPTIRPEDKARTKKPDVSAAAKDRANVPEERNDGGTDQSGDGGGAGQGGGGGDAGDGGDGGGAGQGGGGGGAGDGGDGGGAGHGRGGGGAGQNGEAAASLLGRAWHSISTTGKFIAASLALAATLVTLYLFWDHPSVREFRGVYKPTNIVSNEKERSKYLEEAFAVHVIDEKGEDLLSHYTCKWTIDGKDIDTRFCGNSSSGAALQVPKDILEPSEAKKDVALSVAVLKDDEEVARLNFENPVSIFRKLVPSIVVDPPVAQTYGGQFYAPVQIELSAQVNGMSAGDFLSKNDAVLGKSTKCIWEFADLSDSPRIEPFGGSRNCRQRVYFPNAAGTGKRGDQFTIKLSFSASNDRMTELSLPVSGQSEQLPTKTIPLRYSNFRLDLPTDIVRGGERLSVKVLSDLNNVSASCNWEVEGNEQLNRLLAGTTDCSVDDIGLRDLLPGSELTDMSVRVVGDISVTGSEGQPLPGTEPVVATVEGAFRMRNFDGIRISIRDNGSRLYRPNETVTMDVIATGIEDGRLPDDWSCEFAIENGESVEVSNSQARGGICSTSLPAPTPSGNSNEWFDLNVIVKDEHGKEIERARASIPVAPHSPFFHVFLVDESSKMAMDWNGTTPIEVAKFGIKRLIPTMPPDTTIGIFHFGGGQENDGTVGCERLGWHAPFSALNSFDYNAIERLVSDINSSEAAPLISASDRVVREFRDAPAKKNTSERKLNLIVVTRDGEFCDRSGNLSDDPRRIFPQSLPPDVDMRFAVDASPVYLVITDDVNGLAQKNGENDSDALQGDEGQYVMVPITGPEQLVMALNYTAQLSDTAERVDGCKGLWGLLQEYPFDRSRARLREICPEF